MTRRDVVAEVAALVPRAYRPLLVAVDGVDGAGKTTFADELAEALRATGREVVRASLDDFHHPREHRHARGRTAETVWTRTFDYRALRRELLDPWLGGGGTCRTRWHDLVRDDRVTDDPVPVPPEGVLVFDGVHAQRDELAEVWDLVVWLEVPPEVGVGRMAARDGTPDDPDHPEQRRYVEAQRHYAATCDPRGRADVVVDNTDLEDPVLLAVEDAPSCPVCGQARP